MISLLTHPAHLLVSEYGRSASKDKAKKILKRATQTLTKEEMLEAATHLFIHADEDTVEWVIMLLLTIYTLREEITAWRPAGYTQWSQTPLMTTEERARWVLSQFAANLDDDGVAAGWIEVARQIDADENEGWVDGFCEVLDSIHDLHQEITAWTEFEGAAS